MLATRFTCPFCSKGLRLRNPPVPGHRVLCSGCNRSFVPRPEFASPVPAPTAVEETTPAMASTTPLPEWLRQSVASLPAPADSAVVATAPPIQPVLSPVQPMLTPVQPASPAPLRRSAGLLVVGVLGFLGLLAGSAALAAVIGAKRSRPTTASLEPRDDTPPADERRPDASGPVTTPTPLPADRGDPGSAPTPPRPAAPRDPAPPRARPSPPPVPLMPVSIPATGRSWLPRDVQDKVNKAIDQGVAHLKKNQNLGGAWGNIHSTGMTALPALTLLECGVPAADERIQKAVRRIRLHAPRLQSGKETYELSLALLFLDRLGDPLDRPLIRTIALRLIAGQTGDGGWTYSLPLLSPAEETPLERALVVTRPRHLERAIDQPGAKPLDRPERRPEVPRSLERPTEKPGPGTGAGRIVETKPVTASTPGSTIPLPETAPPKEKRPDDADPTRKGPPAEVIRKALLDVPARLRTVPALQPADAKKPLGSFGGLHRSDNSNTQFATLALWAARRHGIPMERSLDLLAKRFQDTQHADGVWKYHAVLDPNSWGTPAMTGAGLLGLAVGHGLTAGQARAKVKDPGIEKGLTALALHIGKPLGADPMVKPPPPGRGRPPFGRPPFRRGPRSTSPINLYFLWTVERVGVLYDQQKIGDKDWYRWGVDQLLAAQHEDGSWDEGNYPGANGLVDTCLALLFLKRANLAADLTGKLEFIVEAKPPSSSLGR